MWRTGISISGCVLLLVSGQILVKHGLTDLGGFTLSCGSFGREIAKLLSSVHVWAGMLLVGVSSLVWFDLLSRQDLSYVYPMLSLSYVLMLLASWSILHEPAPSALRWAGVLCICLGVVLVSRS